MVNISMFPPELLRFPRDDYSVAAHRSPQTGTRGAVDVILAAAARRASRRWSLVTRMGNWYCIDKPCFCLAVLDKAVQLHAYTRQKRQEQAGWPWPPQVASIGHWRTVVGDLVLIAFDLARAAYLGPETPRSMDIVPGVCRAMEWFHIEGDSVRPYTFSMRPKFDLAQYCGQYYQDPYLAYRNRDPKQRLICHYFRKSSRDVVLGRGRQADVLVEPLARLTI